MMIMLHILVEHMSIGNIKPPFPVTSPPAPPPPGCPPRHRMPPSPRAGRLAVCPTGRTQAAGRLARQSCLGLGDGQQPSAHRSETLPRWARSSEKPGLLGETVSDEHTARSRPTMRLMQSSGTRNCLLSSLSEETERQSGCETGTG